MADEATAPSGYTSEEESQDSMFNRMVGSLTGQSKNTYDLLQKVLKNTGDSSQKVTTSTSSILEGLTEFKNELMLDALLPSQEILGDLLAGVELVVETLDRFSSTERNKSIAATETGVLGGLAGGGGLKIKPKDKPTVADMLSLPVEHSMGYILLYNKLNDIQLALKGDKEGEGEKKKAKGLAGIFSGLLEGVAGLALLAGALIVFAGAMAIFQGIEWGPALVGLFTFGLFITGMVGFAKWVGKSSTDFFEFGVSIAVLTVSLLIFAAGIFVMNWVLPYVSGALPGIGLFTAFIFAMGGVAKLTKDSKKDFFEFGEGIAVLTGSLILFALGVFLMNAVKPYVKGAIDGTALFAGFVLAMGIVANLVSENKKGFQDFGVGIAILTGSLILFAGAIFIMNKVLPFVGGSLFGIGLFMLFVLGMVGISKLVAISMKDFILFGAGVAILTGSLGLFAGAIFLMAKIRPMIPSALLGIGLFTVFMGLAVALSVAAAAAMPMFLLFGAATAVLSLGLIAFAKAIGDLAKVREHMPMAVETLKASKEILIEIAKLGGKTTKAAIAFGPVGTTLGKALIKFATAMEKLGSIKGNMPFAIEGLGAIKEFILDVAKTTSMIDKQAMKSVEVFSKSTKPLSESMINFAKAMVDLGSIKDNMPTAKTGLQAIKEFLFGSKKSDEVSLDRLLDDVEDKTMKKIKKFGAAALPIAETVQKFAKAMVDLSGIKKDMPTALEGLQAIKAFLFADEGVVKGAKGTSVKTSLASVANSLTEDAVEKLNLFSSSIKPIVDTIRGFAIAMATLGTLTPEKMNSAIKGLEAIKEFLFADTPIGSDGKTIGQKLSLVSMMKNVNGEVLERIGVFGENIDKVANPVKKFAETMATLANIKGNINQAVVGLQEIKRFLFGTGTLADNAPLSESSFTSILENVSDVAIRKVGAFGDSASKLMSPIDNLVKSMVPLEKIDISKAKTGLDAIKGFLFGTDGTKDNPGQKSLARMMDDVGVWASAKLAIFGASINPLSESLIKFTTVLTELTEIKDLTAARHGMEMAMNLLLGDPNKPGQVSLKSLITKGTGIFDDAKIALFGKAMQPATEAFGSFVNAMEVLAKLGTGGANTALANIKVADDVLTELNAFTSRVSNTNMATLDTKKLQTAGSNAIAGVNAVNADIISQLRGLSIEDTANIKVVLTNAGELLTIVSNLKYSSTSVTQFGTSLETLGKGFAALQNVNEYNLDAIKRVGQVDIKPLQTLGTLKFPATLMSDLNELAGSLSRIGVVDLSNLDLINQLSTLKLESTIPESFASLAKAVGIITSGGVIEGLSSIGKSIDQILNGSKDLSVVHQITNLANSLEKISAVNITTSITTPLMDLLSKKSDIESLTESITKLADALSTPKTSLLAAVEKGINAANAALQGGPAATATEKASGAVTSPMETAVNDIYELLVKWDSATPGTITTTAGPSPSTVPSTVTNFVPVFAGGGGGGNMFDEINARDFSKEG